MRNHVIDNSSILKAQIKACRRDNIAKKVATQIKEFIASRPMEIAKEMVARHINEAKAENLRRERLAMEKEAALFIASEAGIKVGE